MKNPPAFGGGACFSKDSYKRPGYKPRSFSDSIEGSLVESYFDIALAPDFLNPAFGEGYELLIAVVGGYVGERNHLWKN